MIRRYLGLLALTLAALPSIAPAQGYDRRAWIDDFEQLKAAITERSPNLEWQAVRGLDLAALEARARTRLAATNDDIAARSALERFVRSFGDAHMQLRWPTGPAPSSPTPSGRRSNCSELGYPDDTGKAWRNRCSNRISQRADNAFLAEIEARVRDVAARRPAALLVDVASNGGGNDTSISIARMLSAATLATPALGVVKSAARLADIAEERAALEAGLADATPDEAAFLHGLIDQLARAHAEGAQPCDLSPLWSGGDAGCTRLIRGPFYAGGMIPGEIAKESADKPWAEYVSATVHHRYTHGLWRGRLMVLIDGNSASSTELFAAMLQDAGRATIVGAPSLGAGCGWNLPPENVVLAHSGGILDIPNCARFRRDGRNEIDGVQPDVLVGFRTYDSVQQRVDRFRRKLADALDRTRQARPVQALNDREIQASH